MTLSCPVCKKTGSSHLATHCDLCTKNGVPVTLVRTAAPARSTEIELARKAFIAASEDDFEGFVEARSQLAALGIAKPHSS